MLTNQITDTAYYVFRLLSSKGIGPAKARQIMEISRNNGIPLYELFQKIDDNRLLPEVIMKYAEPLKSIGQQLFETWDKLIDNEIKSVCYNEKEYPQRLSDALGDKAPIILFYKGNIEILKKPSIGFCGSRKASEKGLETARDCTYQMVNRGANIVSGYAHGVDMATHVTALESGGTTTLVLAEGLLHFKLKNELSHVYDSDRTLVISEFLPGVPWSVRNAMQRNATICGLSSLTILIEAQEKGGSFDAGKKCLAMGRPLFAPVYEGMPESATGNRILLEQGALKLMRSKKTGKAHMQQISDFLFGGKLPLTLNK
ncbi:MAG: DNA-processing protein DprA [Nitrospirae bacterium]|nr:DNA-processing protein DprA [Nitrospirota bacterium]